MCIKNLDKKLLLLCLPFFCVTEKTTKTLPCHQERNWNQARTQMGAAPQEAAHASLRPSGLYTDLETAAVPEQTCTLTGLHDRCARIQGRFWLTTMQTSCPISWPGLAALLHGSCWSLLGEQCLWVTCNELPPGEINSHHPAPNNIQASNTCLKFIPSQEIPLLSHVLWDDSVLEEEHFLLWISLNSYFVLS